MIGMDNKAKTLAIVILRSLASGSDDYLSCNYFGICKNLDKALNLESYHICGYRLVEFYACGWEHHTGRVTYPVPYNGCPQHTPWTNPQRLELCTYIANTLQTELDNEEKGTALEVIIE